MSARLLPVLVVAAWLTASPVPASGQSKTRTGPGTEILLIAGDDPGQPYVEDIYRGFRELLDERAPDVVLFREFFDVVRFGDRPAYAAEFEGWLRQKYQNRPMSVLVGTQQQTLQLLSSEYGSGLADVPVIFATLGEPTIDIQATHPTASGIVLENPFPPLLDVIRRVVPSTRRIALIRGTSAAEQARDATYPADIARAGLEAVDLGGLTIAAILERLGTLSDDTIPVLVGFQTDGGGRTFQAHQALRLMVQASRRPIFSINPADIANGVLGGVVFNAHFLGRELAVATLSRLDGQPASILRMPASKHAAIVFDGRELARWGIKESRLPPGSTVLFQAPSLWRDYRRGVIATAAVGLLQTMLIVAVLVQRRHRARVQAALTDSYSRLRYLTARLITAQDEERARIARHLHDEVGQRVASLSIAASGLKRTAGVGSPVSHGLAALQQQAIALGDDLRDLSHELHPGLLEHVGLIETLRARCEEFGPHAAGATASLKVADGWRDVPMPVALCLDRVVQEALRNVARHAAARTVVVSIKRSDGYVVLQVTDDGRGFDPEVHRQGLGLLSLEERVQLLGGTLDIASGRGGGTTLAVTLPTEVANAA